MIEETKRLIREELLPEVHDLDKDVKSLGSVVKWAAVVVVVALAVTGLFIWRFVDYSNCTTDRSKALTGPGNERVSLFLGAFTASITEQSPRARVAALKSLHEARTRYPLLPSDADLAKLTDAQVVGNAQAVRALDVDAEYQRLVKTHPVCSLWSVS